MVAAWGLGGSCAWFRWWSHGVWVVRGAGLARLFCKLTLVCGRVSGYFVAAIVGVIPMIPHLTVIKAGTGVLTKSNDGTLDRAALVHLVSAIAGLVEAGRFRARSLGGVFAPGWTSLCGERRLSVSGFRFRSHDEHEFDRTCGQSRRDAYARPVCEPAR